MKKSNSFLVLLLLLSATFSFAQTGSRVSITVPVEYNDYIVQAQDKIGEKLLDLMEVVNNAESTHEQAKAALSVLNNTIDLSINTLENLEVFSPDYGLRKSALDLFLFYQRTMRTKYVTMTDELYAASPNYELLNKMVSEISQEEKAYDDAFQSAQTQFASSNNFVLEQNAMQDEINK